MNILKRLIMNLTLCIPSICCAQNSERGDLDARHYKENSQLQFSLAQDPIANYPFQGEENVLDLDIWMAAEDFSYYSHETDACFYRLGTRNEAKGIISSVHTPTFDIDESALAIGPGLMAYLALKELGYND